MEGAFFASLTPPPHHQPPQTPEKHEEVIFYPPPKTRTLGMERESTLAMLDVFSTRVAALEAQLRAHGVEVTDEFKAESEEVYAAIHRPIRVLELFSGTGSVGKVAREKGWDVVSLDIDPRADINVDILLWDYRSLGMTFDVVWGSPPCTMYSSFQDIHTPKHLRDLGPSNALVMKTIEIINYFQPSYYFIENPQTGCLKEQSFMQPLPYHDVDYCMYGYMGRKRTRLWTNYTEFQGKLCDKTCGAYGEYAISPMRVKSNPSGRTTRWGHPEVGGAQGSLDARHAIPPPLIRELFAFA